MFSISRKENTKIGKFKLNLAFDNVLRCYEMIDKEDIDELLKIDLVLDMLVKDDCSKLSDLDKRKLLHIIFRDFINTNKKNIKSSNKKAMDYIQDSKYIYASFMQAYGIDLLEEQGKMSWMRFTALLEGLPENTKLKEVISIRLRKLPKLTKHNMEERKALLEQKAFYRLESTEVNTNNYQEGANALFNYLKSIAIKE